jgi:MscS family membrane protein
MKISAWGVLVLLSCGLLGKAQSLPAATSASAPAKSEDPLHRESPRSAVYNFLEACHAHNYELAWRYIDLRNAPAKQRTDDGPQLAQQLEKILDRDVDFDVASLSGQADGNRADGSPPNREKVASFRLDGKQEELDLEHVTLRSGMAVWLFAADNISLIPKLATMASDSPIERHLPPVLVNWKLLGTAIWRWIALILLAAILGPLSRLVTRPIVALAEFAARRLMPRANLAALEVLVGPLRLLLSIAVFRAGVEWIGLSALFRLYLERIVTLVFFVALAWLAMGIVDILMGRVRAVLQTKHHTFSYTAMPMASRFLKIIVGVLMIAAVLSSWGYNTTTILAGLGVGGLAVALAAQKTIENLFGGVAVITDQPVAVGDFCRVGDLVGTVEDVGLRSTRIRTLNRTIVTVPNAEFSSMKLENFSKQDKMWFHITLNLRRDTLPGQVRELLQAITKMLKEHAKVEPGELPVRFVGVGTYSLDMEVFAYILTRDGDEFLKLQQELLLWILDAVQAAGTSLALPTTAYFAMGGASPNAPNQAAGPARQKLAPVGT